MSGQRYNVFYIDWGNSTSSRSIIDLLRRFPDLKQISLGDTVADTLRACANESETPYFWVTSSLADYTRFNFNDHNEYGLEPYLQVFGTGTWFGSKLYFDQQPLHHHYIDSFPDLHFAKSSIKPIDKLLDIVYISNNEPDADKHYQHLLETVKTGNKIHRIDGVNGRTAAYQAAARVSTTAWFFAVFAKIEVDPEFDWTWKPKLEPWHTIFYAKNPVNGLVYGHMAVVAYSKYQTLKTDEPGLDFVMSAPHTVEPILSGIAHYNQDPIVTWRTAFREAIKLRRDDSAESQEKLQIWTSVGTGNYANWSMRGARDGVKYYEETGGDFEQLMFSYDWAWLNDRFQRLYKR
jgi:hypothetical protein